MLYNCNHCGNMSEVGNFLLSSGLVLTCGYCSEQTVIVLHKHSGLMGLNKRTVTALEKLGITTVTQLINGEYQGVGGKTKQDITDYLSDIRGVVKSPIIFEDILSVGEILLICGDDSRSKVGVELMKASIINEYDFLGRRCLSSQQVFYITENTSPLLSYNFNETEIERMNNNLILFDGVPELIDSHSSDYFAKFIMLLNRKFNIICIEILGFVENQTLLLTNFKQECLKIGAAGVLIITPSEQILNCSQTTIISLDNQITLVKNGEIMSQYANENIGS